MSLANYKKALNLLSSDNCTINVYAIKYSHLKAGTNYTCYDLHFSDKTALTILLSKISEIELKKLEEKQCKVNPYDGFNPTNSIDKLHINDSIITENIHKLIAATLSSNDSVSINEAKANAYAIRIIYQTEEGPKDLYLFVNRKPSFNYANKHLFKMHTNSLVPVTEEIIQFQTYFDILVFEDTLYMPTKNFETMLNLEHTHKIRCKNFVDSLEQDHIISNPDFFRNIALSGQNPRKFMTYDSKRLDQAKSAKGKKLLKERFNLRYDEKENHFIIEDAKQADYFITILCNKAQKDLFDDDIIYEVSSAQKMDL